jgi:hypothetical protein
VDDIEIRFTEREVAQILWVLSEAADRAHEAHALSDVALIEDTLRMVRNRSTAVVPSSRYALHMVERVKVTEAVRRTGVPGTAIFLAIRHGEITSERDDHGYDWVDPDEVAALGVQQ